MHARWIAGLSVALWVGCLCGAASGQEEEDAPLLPKDVAATLAEYQKAAAAIQAEAEAKLQPHRDRAVARLKSLQDGYTRAAKLDEALAVRKVIREVLGVLPDPGAMRATPREIGQVRLYEVKGELRGAVWGTEVYTSDSHLGTAAVHAGLLRPGQLGLVRVRILPGQQSYAGTTQHGVTSQPYGPWNTSFVFEPVKEKLP